VDRPPDSLRDERSGHIDALDGLRAVAVLLVLMQHGIYLTSPPGPRDIVSRIGGIGWTGVDVFFVLSGFLITGILLDTRDSPKFFQRFYIRRVLRIFPVYYSAILFLLFAPLLRLVSPEDGALLRSYQGWYWGYLVNFLFALHPQLSLDRFSGHFWSLAVEEQFYLIWPMLVALLDRRSLRQATIVIIAMAVLLRVILVALHAEPGWAYTMLPARVDSLALGALLAIDLRDRSRVPTVRRWLPRMAVGSLVTILGVIAFNRPHMFPFWSPSVQLVGYSAVGGLAYAAVGGLVLSPPRATLRRLCELPLMTRIGRYSYAMYVVHLPLMVWLNDAVRSRGVPVERLTAPSGRLLFWLSSTLLSVLVAHVSWIAVERPFLRLKRWFPYSVSRNSRASHAPGLAQSE
jgi:peptidoglycan/LPS O-acetylase OafA/YrhL